ncbi:MAG: hypothetical protein M3480_10015 [Verrucomicrobiota bacterium]|nr:hypothetical protein [Verrucomicrobiota bacterium]
MILDQFDKARKIGSAITRADCAIRSSLTAAVNHGIESLVHRGILCRHRRSGNRQR